MDEEDDDEDDGEEDVLDDIEEEEEEGEDFGGLDDEEEGEGEVMTAGIFTLLSWMYSMKACEGCVWYHYISFSSRRMIERRPRDIILVSFSNSVTTRAIIIGYVFPDNCPRKF